MSCYECLRKAYCPYIHHFNHDKSVGCIEFQDSNYPTYISNTLNISEKKMNKELEAYNEFLDIIEVPVKSHLLNSNDTQTLERYRVLRTQIETALENYEELTDKPIILYGRTYGHSQAIIDTICKNYKEVKITNLEDEKKVKALEIIKEKEWFDDFMKEHLTREWFTKDELDLLKEALL